MYIITLKGRDKKRVRERKRKVRKTKERERREIVIRFCNNIRHFSNEINKRGIILVEGAIFQNQ